MHWRKSIAATLVCVTLGLVLPPANASAAAPCIYKAALPATISVGQDYVEPAIRLTSNRSECMAVFQYQAMAWLTRKGGVDVGYRWSNSRTSDNARIYALYVAPGVYTAHGQVSASDGSWNATPASFAAGSTTIKFTSGAWLSTVRTNSRVALTASVRRFSTYSGWVRASSTQVQFQRLIAKRGSTPAYWQTFQTIKANASGVSTYAYTNAKSMQYRAVALETSQAFRSISAPHSR